MAAQEAVAGASSAALPAAEPAPPGGVAASRPGPGLAGRWLSLEGPDFLQPVDPNLVDRRASIQANRALVLRDGKWSAVAFVPAADEEDVRKVFQDQLTPPGSPQPQPSV